MDDLPAGTLLSHGCIMRELVRVLLRLHVGALRALRAGHGLAHRLQFCSHALALSERVPWVS